MDKLKPVDKEGIFDRYVTGLVASRIKIFGKIYYAIDILKTFDPEVYELELHFYFERCSVYTKIGEEYYRTFHIRRLLGITTPLPSGFTMSHNTPIGRVING